MKPELDEFESIFTVELMGAFGFFNSFPDNEGTVRSILPESMLYLGLVECLATADLL
jgi:hypothetical protein